MFVDAFVKALGERMLGFKTKKNQASANWRVRARLIDPRKTKLTIIRRDVTDVFDMAYDVQRDREQENAEVPKENQHLWKTETKEDLGIPVSFKPVDD